MATNSPKTGMFPATSVNHRMSTNKSIAFVPDGERIDFKNDVFAKTHKDIYKAKFHLQHMANQAVKIEMDHMRSINRFNFIARAQLQQKEKQKQAKEQIFL